MGDETLVAPMWEARDDVTVAPERPRRAFVLDLDGKHDVSDAERYGRVTAVYRDGEPRPPLWSNSFVREFMERTKFDPFLDFLIITGNMNANVLVVAHLVANYDNVNLLLFDSAQCEYVLRTIT